MLKIEADVSTMRLLGGELHVGGGRVQMRDIAIIRPNRNGKGEYHSQHLHLVIDTRFNPHSSENATQDGEIVAVNPNNKYGLKPGDHVYTHHFLNDEESFMELNGEKLSQLSIESIYCRVKDGEVEMVNDHNLVEPMDEPEQLSAAGLVTNPIRGRVKNKGIARHINPKLREQGVRQGDTVCFTDQGDYEMRVEGKAYYRMKNEDIIAVLN